VKKFEQELMLSSASFAKFQEDLKMLVATIIVIALFFYALYYQYCSYIALWLGVMITFLVVTSEILKSKKETEKLISVVLFLISLRILTMLRTKPWGFTLETDSSFALQLSNSISEIGQWYPGMGFLRETQYSQFPALHFWAVALAKISGLDLVFLARFLLPVLSGSLTVVFYYLAIRLILTRKVATWASLILCLNPVFTFFDAGYVHESFALVFYAIYLFVVFRVYFMKYSEYRLTVIGMFVTFITVFAHQWSSENLLIISIVFFCFPGVYARLISLLHHTNFKSIRTISIRFVEITYIIIFAWLMFVAFSMFHFHMKMIAEFFATVFNPFAEHSYPTMELYTLQEKIMISLGVLVLIILGTSELIIGLLRKEKTPSEIIFESWFIFSSAYFFIISFLSPKWFHTTISLRSWSFAFFGLSPLIAKSIAKKGNGSKGNSIPKIEWKKSFVYFKTLALIFPLISTVIQAPTWVRDPSLFLPSESYYFTAQWVKRYLQNETVTVDLISNLVLVPYGRVQSALGERFSDLNQVIPALYQSKNLQNIPKDWRILVFNKYIHTWYPNISSNSTLLDGYYNRIYDSTSLIIFKGRND